MSSLFYIPNHSAAELKESSPEDLSVLPSVHDKFDDKPAFAKWEHSIKTEHVFYTAVEPLQPGLRVSKDNPPVRCHGLIADYDGMVDDKMHAGAIANLPGIPPTWVTRTFSGKARWIWMFENAIPVFNTDLFAKFMTALAKQLKVGDCLPGLDPVYTSPYSVYELGRDWKQPAGNVKVPTTTAYAILADVSKKAKFDGPDIPLDAVEAECRRRWGDRVPETFEKGSRCARFWDKNADNATGALIHESGIQAFTGEGRFLDWADLLGSNFTRGFIQQRVGGAIEGIHYDSKKFWVRDADECWSPLPTEHIRNMLHVKHGLSPTGKKGEPSQVNVALNSIVELQKVSGVFPFLYSPTEIVRKNKSKFLNISNVDLVTAQQTPAKWGEDFPWVSDYLDQLFDDEQLPIFLSWLAHFYQSARNGQLRNGQGLFVAGPPGSGKTFLSNVLIAKLMGGSQEVSSFILGTTQFITAHEKPVWTVDDAVASSDNRAHTLYSQLVKKVIANFSLPYHPKGVDAVDQEWLGRLIVTLNDDPESIQMLPSVEHSILDKVIFLKADSTTVDFTDSTKIVAKELPAFAAFLRDWETPQELKGDWRFGIKSWQHPDLLQHAKQASPTAGLSELLDLWRRAWFRQDDVDEWNGTALELMKDLSETESIKSLVRSTVTSRGMLGRGLSKLVTEGTPWISSKRTSLNRLYTIKPD
jgi:hypothetical protein